MENVRETLERMFLEPERVKLVEIAIDEYHKLPQIIDDFVKKIEEIGLNPFKGF